MNNQEEITKLLDEMATKLKLINLQAFSSAGFKEDALEDLQYLHKMVMRKSHFSPSEIEAIINDIRSLKVSN
ncbi:DUF1128 domain-containing protein [Bacillus carboniphilus]|uniref:DUF1128 domain-containing protein n=1 Tax=Bacillus carboniphilus TaxID=86663 RepID=A0ABN0WMJ7_9BACI